MVIVDTTVWVDYLRGDSNQETAWLDREMKQRRLGLTDLILCEVLQGVRDPGMFLQVHDELLPTGGVELATEAARNYRVLRAEGYTVRKTIDCWIATFCLMSGHELLHRDRDFDPFEKRLGMKVI